MIRPSSLWLKNPQTIKRSWALPCLKRVAEPAEVQPGQEMMPRQFGVSSGDKASDFETDDHAERNGEQGPCVAAPAASENSAAENEASAVPVANREELLEKPGWSRIQHLNPAKPLLLTWKSSGKRSSKMAPPWRAARSLCPQCGAHGTALPNGIRFYCCPNFSVCREVRGIYE